MNQNSKHVLCKVFKDEPDSRDQIYSNNHCMLSNLPKRVDLTSKLTKVENQLTLGSCSAQSMSTFMEFVNEHIYGKEHVELSPLYLYYKEREMEGNINIDAGACLRDGMKVLNQNGICRDKLHPYKIDEFKKKPSLEADMDAKNYKLTQYQRLLTVDQIKNCLYQGFPVVFGMILYRSFENKVAEVTGNIQLPDRKTEANLGGHAMLICGYDDDKNGGVFIVRNSWGKQWGDNGNCYIRYEQVMEDACDFWTYKPENGVKTDNSFIKAMYELVNLTRNKFMKMIMKITYKLSK